MLNYDTRRLSIRVYACGNPSLEFAVIINSMKSVYTNYSGDLHTSLRGVVFSSKFSFLHHSIEIPHTICALASMKFVCPYTMYICEDDRALCWPQRRHTPEKKLHQIYTSLRALACAYTNTHTYSRKAYIKQSCLQSLKNCIRKTH